MENIMVNPYNIVNKYHRVIELLKELSEYVITYDSATRTYFCGICGYVGHSFTSDGKLEFAHNEDCEVMEAEKLIKELE